MHGSVPQFTRFLSLLLVLSIAPGWPAWSQQTQPAPAAPPGETPKAPQAPPPAAAEPQTQTTPEQPPPAEAKAEAPEPEAATLKGRVVGADRKSPMPGAVVHAVGPDETVVSSSPAVAKGNYLLKGLPPGTYMLAVSVDGGVFSVESPVGITSPQAFRVDLAAVPAEGASFSVPGLTATPRGFAYIVQGKQPGKSTFWRSPKGIALLGVTAAAVALILAESGGSDEEEPVSRWAP